MSSASLNNNGVRAPELLAPAGGPEAGYAALHYGADAIYLGLPRFSARGDASNFSMEDLVDITALAHSLNPRRRVYIALNTLVLQRETDALVDDLAAVAEAGADAAIVQDVGVLSIVRRHFPELRLHASTQMAVHNRPGAEMARELGCSRVTLARELTLDELVGIAAVPDLETEVFIHGALCYSYSGLCLFSSHIMGRSGNRGRCAYLCRDRYREGSGQRFVFSMKDLALPECLPDLRRIGVSALKIEGRMKSPLYVAATVKYYRALLDGSASPREADEMARDIKTIFSRPWTDLHVRSRRNRNVVEPDYVGHRGILVGKVQSVISGRTEEDRMRFKTSRPIEAHDGLQIDVPGLSRPYGFAVSKLRVKDGDSFVPVFEAPAGALIDVALPLEHPEFSAGAQISCSSSQEIKRRYRFEKPNPARLPGSHPVDFEINIDPDGIKAKACCRNALRLAAPGPAAENGGACAISASASVSGSLEPARNAANVDDVAAQAFTKLGGTRFAPGRIEVDNPGALFVPVSLLNQVRRRLIDELETKWREVWDDRRASVKSAVNSSPYHSIAVGCSEDPPEASPVVSSRITWSLKTDSAACLSAFESSDWQDTDDVIIEIPHGADSSLRPALEDLAGMVGIERIRLALPVIIRGWEMESAQKILMDLAAAGWRRWQAANPGAWKMLRATRGFDLEISADWPLYVMNRASAQQLTELGASSFTLSPEDGKENLRELTADFPGRAVAIVFQDTPLMISEACVMQRDACNNNGRCGAGVLRLESSFGEKIRVIRRGCRMIVINEKPFCLGGRIGELTVSGVTRLRADFLYREYSPGKARELWRRLRMNETVPETHTGNFDRGL